MGIRDGNGLMSPQSGLMAPQKGLMSPHDGVSGRAVVGVGFLGSRMAVVVVLGAVVVVDFADVEDVVAVVVDLAAVAEAFFAAVEAADCACA